MLIKACHQSIERNHRTRKVKSTQKVASCLVITRRNGAVKPGKEVLNQVASLVQVLVIAARLFARAARCNHDGLARLKQWLNDPFLRVIRLVCNDCLGWRVLEENLSSLQIMGLSGCQVKSSGIA